MSSPPPAWKVATSSTRCARSSPRSITKPKCAHARDTRCSTSATPATTKRWAPSRSPPSRCTCSTREEQLDELLQQVDDPERVAMLAQTTLAHNEWTDLLAQTRRTLPAVVDRVAQRPLLRDHQPADRTHSYRDRRGRSRRHRQREFFEHDRADQGCSRRGLPDRAPSRRPRGARPRRARRSDDRGRDRGRERARGSRRVGDREARTGARRGGGARHRRGRVLPPAARIAGVDPGTRRGRRVRTRRRSEPRAARSVVR